MMKDLCPYFTNDGTVGLFSDSNDDIYHSTYGALSESWQKFIFPASLHEYVSSHKSVKILDICYGIGYNSKTALQVFTENFLKINKKNKKKYVIEKNNIAEIYADNIIEVRWKNSSEEKLSNIHEVEFFEDKISGKPSHCIDELDSDNIETQKNSYFSSCTDVNNDLHPSILIDAVDTDEFLMNLSPFITTGRRKGALLNKYIYQKYHNYLNDSEKLSQVRKIINFGVKPLPKNLRLKKESSIIILQKIIENNSDAISDKNLQNIFTDSKYLPFLSNYMMKFAKFYQNSRYKTSKTKDKLPFLHNIYYQYISKSYKNVKKILKICKIDFNLHKIDAREYVKSTDTKYNFIFLDAFTPSKCPCLWTLDFFKQLYSRLEDDGMILTYSNSATVRNAFLQCGFAVGKTYDENLKKFVGTVAAKNGTLIKYALDEKDIELINSKAGIPYRDKNLNLDCPQILTNRDIESKNSNLASSSRVMKKFKDNDGDKVESL